METKNLILICVVIICLCALSSYLILYGNLFKEPTETFITFDNTTITEGEKITIKIAAVNHTSLNNKTLHVNVSSKNGKVKTYNLTTDGKGKAKLKLSKKGNYKISILFEGDNDFKSSFYENSIKVKEKETEQPKLTDYSKNTASNENDENNEGDFGEGGLNIEHQDYNDGSSLSIGTYSDGSKFYDYVYSDGSEHVELYDSSGSYMYSVD